MPNWADQPWVAKEVSNMASGSMDLPAPVLGGEPSVGGSEARFPSAPPQERASTDAWSLAKAIIERWTESGQICDSERREYGEKAIQAAEVVHAYYSEKAYSDVLHLRGAALDLLADHDPDTCVSEGWNARRTAALRGENVDRSCPDCWHRRIYHYDDILIGCAAPGCPCTEPGEEGA